MQLSRFGEIVWKCWNQLPRHYSNIQLDAFVVMPNHVHGIIWLVEPGGKRMGGVGIDGWGVDGAVGAGLQNSNVIDVKRYCVNCMIC